MALSGATTPGNDGVLRIPQSYGNLTIRLLSTKDTQLRWGLYPSAEVQSVYSAAPID